MMMVVRVVGVPGSMPANQTNLTYWRPGVGGARPWPGHCLCADKDRVGVHAPIDQVGRLDMREIGGRRRRLRRRSIVSLSSRR